MTCGTQWLPWGEGRQQSRDLNFSYVSVGKIKPWTYIRLEAGIEVSGEAYLHQKNEFEHTKLPAKGRYRESLPYTWPWENREAGTDLPKYLWLVGTRLKFHYCAW